MVNDMDKRTQDLRLSLKAVAAGLFLLACCLCTAGEFRWACVFYIVGFWLMPVSSNSWW